jgi:hypothetical protein
MDRICHHGREYQASFCISCVHALEDENAKLLLQIDDMKGRGEVIARIIEGKMLAFQRMADDIDHSGGNSAMPRACANALEEMAALVRGADTKAKERLADHARSRMRR